MKPLSKIQRALLGYIQLRLTTGVLCAPSFTDMQAATGLKSKSGVFHHLRALEARGLIVRKKYQAYGLNLTDAGWREPVA